MTNREINEHVVLLAVNVAIIASSLGLPNEQVAYLGAFSFFFAVSLMFLAFGKLRAFGGIYKDLQQAEESEK